MMFTLTNIVYAQEGADINSFTSGSIGGVPFTMEGIKGSTRLELDFSSGFYAAAPLSDSQTAIFYDNTSQWSIVFESEVEHFKLYCVDWENMEITFNQPFAVLDGGVNLSNIGNNTLKSINSAGNGIIEFTGAIKTLRATSVNGADGSIQAMTFGKTATALSTNVFTKPKNTIKLYPIPVDDVLRISNLKETNSYTIFNSLGVQLQKGRISDDETIHLQNLSAGLYFVSLQDGNMVKFIKE